MGELFRGDEDITNNYSADNSPIMTGKSGDYRGPKLGRLERTTAFVRAYPKAVDPVMEYRNGQGRMLVAMVRFGIHDTIDGHTAYKAKSYMPKSALDIASNIALYALVSETTAAERKKYAKRKERAKLQTPTPEKTVLPKSDDKKTQPDEAVESKPPAEPKKTKPKKDKPKKKSVFIDDDF